MIYSKFAAKYLYNQLITNTPGSEIEKIGATLFNSKIRLMPHQVDAALFSFRSPLKKGVILADEVGLGKTIEAGMIIAQLWFEKKARVLIVAPASLMRQWNSELYEKFGIQSSIVDRKAYQQSINKGYTNPFVSIGKILICSYQMCSIEKDRIKQAGFDLVIVDEAHKLRNVHNEKSITANNIKEAIMPYKKVLLTATPIQNNLMDLYGIVSVLDDGIFGDKSVFKENYIKNYEINRDELESRISKVIKRTLRNQVTQYIQYGKQIPTT